MLTLVMRLQYGKKYKEYLSGAPQILLDNICSKENNNITSNLLSKKRKLQIFS